ncbi:hypothetical protein COCOBI_02-8740 [Coccomyxa sp. Obi]|nr:hypothetical protein COCOBI_02-8740 [Coccomyxa sp. Obi]
MASSGCPWLATLLCFVCLTCRGCVAQVCLRLKLSSRFNDNNGSVCCYTMLLSSAAVRFSVDVIASGRQES